MNPKEECGNSAVFDFSLYIGACRVNGIPTTTFS